jgi:hypothetical protein
MYNSIFQKEWWLEAVSPGQWGEVKIKQGKDTIARLPYVINKRYSRVILSQPPLTQTLGPWLRSSTAKNANMLAEQKDLMMELIHQLPTFDFFAQNFHYSITNWLPFYWQGFEQTTRYTYLIEDISDTEILWEGFLPNIRTDIKKAQNRYGVEVVSDMNLDIFMDLNELTFRRQGLKIPYARDIVRRIDKACIENNARKIFFGRDKEGKIHAAVYIIWDEDSAYYLMGGSDPELRNSGATSLCMWEAIKFAAGVTKKFDFEGSMIEPVERFFRAFGAKQVPYFSVSKINSRLARLAQAAGIIKKAALGI